MGGCFAGSDHRKSDNPNLYYLKMPTMDSEQDSKQCSTMTVTVVNTVQCYLFSERIFDVNYVSKKNKCACYVVEHGSSPSCL